MTNEMFKQWSELTDKLIKEQRTFYRKEDELSMQVLMVQLSRLQGQLSLLTEEDYEEVGNEIRS